MFFDDVVIASSSIEEHLRMLRAVFAKLRGANLKLKLPKCTFLQPKIKFLGFEVSGEGISTCSDKIEAVRDWPTPKSVSNVKRFLGLAGFYRKFIKGFSKIATPLTQLTVAEQSFHWTKACAVSFRILKEKLCNSPVLAFPDFSATAEPFILDTDASACGIGGVLSQKQDGRIHVIAYASKTLTKSQRNYSTYDRELLACVTFIGHFCFYLIGKTLSLQTDQAALRALYFSGEPSGRRARWLEKLAEYSFDILHRPGRHHGNADTLSRSPLHEGGIGSSDISQTTDSCTQYVATSTQEPLMPAITLDQLRQAQQDDSDLCVVSSWFQGNQGLAVAPSDCDLQGQLCPITHRNSVLLGITLIRNGRKS